MREEDTGVLPVGEGDRLIGMVTDRDVALRVAAEGKNPAQTKVREVMTPEVRYVFEDEDLGHVAENMAEQQLRRMPVVSRDKRLVGIVSLSDISRNGRPPHLAGEALRGITREGGMHQSRGGFARPSRIRRETSGRLRERRAKAGVRSRPPLLDRRQVSNGAEFEPAMKRQLGPRPP